MRNNEVEYKTNWVKVFFVIVSVIMMGVGFTVPFETTEVALGLVTGGVMLLDCSLEWELVKENLCVKKKEAE